MATRGKARRPKDPEKALVRQEALSALPPGVRARRLIEGIRLKVLRRIPDERGSLMEMLRSDDPLFIRFGQAYMTSAYPGVVKAWHYHMKQTDSFICVKGMMKVVCYDGREGSATAGEVNEFFIGEQNPLLVQIPPYVFHGFKSIGLSDGIIINLPTEIYDGKQPDEYRLPAHTDQIPYDWARKDG